MVESQQRALTLVAVGDVRLARRDHKASFARAASVLRDADIAFFNCDALYAESGTCTPMRYYERAWRDENGTLASPLDPRKLAALTEAGFNVCTLANSQFLHWGVTAAVAGRERLEAAGLAVCGFGRTMSEARQAAIVEKNGVKVAFLGYLSVGPYEYKAESAKPGLAVIRAYSVYEPVDFQPGGLVRIHSWPDEGDVQRMQDDIRLAREQADLVVVANHWGIRRQPLQIPHYEWDLGHAAVDAGADLVLGTRPQILKAIELYKGKVIAHSLGSFALEEELGRQQGEPITPRLKYYEETEAAYGPRSTDDQKSLILKCTIDAGKITRVSFIPVQLEADASPQVLARSDPRFGDVARYVEQVTRAVGLTTELAWDGDEVVINTSGEPQ